MHTLMNAWRTRAYVQQLSSHRRPRPLRGSTRGLNSDQVCRKIDRKRTNDESVRPEIVYAKVFCNSAFCSELVEVSLDLLCTSFDPFTLLLRHNYACNSGHNFGCGAAPGMARGREGGKEERLYIPERGRRERGETLNGRQKSRRATDDE